MLLWSYYTHRHPTSGHSLRPSSPIASPASTSPPATPRLSSLRRRPASLPRQLSPSAGEPPAARRTGLPPPARHAGYKPHWIMDGTLGLANETPDVAERALNDDAKQGGEAGASSPARTVREPYALPGRAQRSAPSGTARVAGSPCSFAISGRYASSQTEHSPSRRPAVWFPNRTLALSLLWSPGMHRLVHEPLTDA